MACLFGLILSCGAAAEGPVDTGVVGPETQPAAVPAAAIVDQDGPVEVEDVAPPSVYVVTEVSLDQAPDGRLVEYGVVVVMKVGRAEPLARIASASIADLRVNDAGTEVAWREGAHRHTYDVESGIHLRYGWPARP